MAHQCRDRRHLVHGHGVLVVVLLVSQCAKVEEVLAGAAVVKRGRGALLLRFHAAEHMDNAQAHDACVVLKLALGKGVGEGLVRPNEHDAVVRAG